MPDAVMASTLLLLVRFASRTQSRSQTQRRSAVCPVVSKSSIVRCRRRITYYFDDNNIGGLVLYYINDEGARVNVDLNFGTVDYQTGEVKFGYDTLLL